MSVILVLSQVAYSEAASAADQMLNASGNTTLLTETITSGWQASGSYRGTTDILWSCIVTIVACIYTAIHLNVPRQNTPKWKRLATKLYWAAFALIGPELVVSAASRQWRAARHMTAELNKIKPSTKTPDAESSGKMEAHEFIISESLVSNTRFGAAYGFWIIMGGFVIDISDIHDQYSLVTLTSKGAMLLAELGLLPEVSQSQIADRSKTNAIGKLVICIQASWMILQCITRHVAAYPLSLLEIHTIVHVVCALCIYALWWNKPLDVEEPIVVNTTAARELVSLMVMATIPHEGEHVPEIKTIKQARQRQNDLEANDYVAYQSDTHAIIKLESSKKSTSLEIHKLPPLVDTSVHPTESLKLRSGEGLACGMSTVSENGTELNAKDIRRWQLAASMLRDFQLDVSVGGIIEDVDEKYAQSISTAQSANSIASRPLERWESIGRLDGISDGAIAALSGTTLLLPIVYGGLHLLAWNFEFPSHMEEMLWKISGIGIIVTMSAVAFIALLYALVEEQINNVWPILDRPLAALVLFLSSIMTVFYALARLYLVVEAFISLRRVPLGVWATTPWLQSFPHI